MIEYYISMFIFFLILVATVYIIYRWNNAMNSLNEAILNSTQGLGKDNTPVIENASLQQPCVMSSYADDSTNGDPVCDKTVGLTCITQMYKGNGAGTNTGVCLSQIGYFCNTIKDCVPSAHACIDNICENITETINLPCNYDSDCIGGVTCIDCKTGIGPCIDRDGNCVELENGECPANVNVSGETVVYSLCDNTSYKGKFRYDHVCDKSLGIPRCKYNLAPKDQGCSVNSDCVQLEGGAFCFKGDFKTPYNENGIINVPTYRVKDIGTIDSKVSAVKLDFGNSLLTIESFFIGTEVNFINSGGLSDMTTNYKGPYYITGTFGNDTMTLTDQKIGPKLEEYVHFSNKFIHLNEADYFAKEDILLNIENPVDYDVIFGVLPPMLFFANCYYNTTSTNFKIINFISGTDKKPITGGKLNIENVTLGVTEVRFNIFGKDGDINSAEAFKLKTIGEDGLTFTVDGNIDSVKSYSDDSNSLEVMFGNAYQPDLLNVNKGVCITKLPPTANIKTDSRYDLTNYPGNPCIDSFDNTFGVSVSDDKFCKITDTLTGPGSVCQFSRTYDGKNYDPLPCSDDTVTYEGIPYKLTCLLDEDISETLRNNFSFLNPAYGGICAYPVKEKFKSCDPYGINCKPPYICSSFEGGNFCDSRFDLFQCNNLYRCPPGFACSDGLCRGVSNTGNCIRNTQCSSLICKSTNIWLSFYNSTIDQKNNNVTRLVDLVNLTNISGDASTYSLLVKTIYNNGTLTTYVFIYKNTTYKLWKIENPLATTPTTTDITNSIPHTTTQQVIFLFNIKDEDIELWGFNYYNGVITMTSFYTTSTSQQSPHRLNCPNVPESIDIYQNKLLVTVMDSSNRPEYVVCPPTNPAAVNYKVLLFDDYTNPNPNNYKSCPVPHYQNMPNDIEECKFDLMNINDKELDFISIYKSQDVSNPILAVRHKFRSSKEFTQICTDNGNGKPIGCFIDPYITNLESLKNSPVTCPSTGNSYKISNKFDINTIMAFSGYQISISNIQIRKIYQNDGFIVVTTDNAITTSDKYPISITGAPEYYPLSIYENDRLTNYDNTLSKFLEYPNWIDDLQDLIVGDNYNPKLKKLFYEPNLENRNYYAVLDMYTKYTDKETELIMENEDPNVTENNTYMFKFSSFEDELSLTINETIPIRINSSDTYKRFSMCNETGNMFFLTNKCS